jgi:MFS family permease
MRTVWPKEGTHISPHPARFENLRANMRDSVLNGAFGTVATGIVSTFVPLYLIDALHASNQIIGWLNALPALTGLIGSLLGAVWVPRLLRYRNFSVLSYLGARLSYLLMAAVPASAATASTLIVAVNSVGNVPQTLGTLGWQALMAKLIPSGLRESFFGHRYALITIVGLGGTIVTGIGLQFFNPDWPVPYRVLFVVAGLLGCIEVTYLVRHREPMVGERPRPTRWRTWTNLWTVPRFRRYVLLAAFFNFGWQLSWPLFSIYQIKTAHATGLWIGLFTIATQATEIVTFRWWGRLAQKQGGLVTMGFSGLGIGLVPVLTILSPNLWYLTAVNLYSGLFASGMTLLLFTELLQASPIAERSGAIVFYNVVLGGVAFLAPELGVYLLPVFGMDGTMLLSTIWRIVASILFLMPLQRTIFQSLLAVTRSPSD